MSPHEPEHDTATLRALRRMLLALLWVGIGGTGVELLLLGHTEGVWQVLPLVLLGMSGVVLAWHVRAKRRTSTRLLQWTMGLLIASGIAGVLLHYKGNVEFELELHPSLTGVELFWGAMTGATPSLAPATMALLGCLGLAYCYRFPTRSDEVDRERPG